MSAILIEARDLRVRRGSETIGSLSFTVSRGEIHALLGHPGSGKTLLLEALAGLRRPSGGRVLLGGTDAYPVRDGMRTGAVWRDGGLFPGLTVTEILEGWRRWTLDPLPVDEAVALTGLEAVAEVRFERLTSGQRRLLDLSLALVNRSDVLFLDEPTSGLGSGAIHRIWQTLRRVSAAGTTVLLATRDAAEARRADRITVVDGGRPVIPRADSTFIVSQGAAVRRNPPQIRSDYGPNNWPRWCAPTAPLTW